MKLLTCAGALAVGTLALTTFTRGARAEDPGPQSVFSGPQVGEPITGFVVVGMNGVMHDQEFDAVERYGAATTVYCFMHEVSRATGKAIRALDDACEARKGEGLRSLFVLLGSDQDATERYGFTLPGLLDLECPVAVCFDGQEGPGAWGLDDSLALTIVVARDNRVVGNFPLLGANATDVPRIMEVVDRALLRVESFADVEAQLLRLQSELRELRAEVERLREAEGSDLGRPGRGARESEASGRGARMRDGRSVPKNTPRSVQETRLRELLDRLTGPDPSARRTEADLAQLRTLLEEFSDLTRVFLESERRIAAGQTGSEHVRRELRALAESLESGMREQGMRDGDR